MWKVRLYVMVLVVSMLMGMLCGCGFENGTVRAYPQGDPNAALESIISSWLSGHTIKISRTTFMRIFRNSTAVRILVGTVIWLYY